MVSPGPILIFSVCGVIELASDLWTLKPSRAREHLWRFVIWNYVPRNRLGVCWTVVCRGSIGLSLRVFDIHEKHFQEGRLKFRTDFALNFGPQHPSAHGVLRLILRLVGEVVLAADPHIGLLHRGTEKLIEHKSVIQSTPYLDRLDYVSMLSMEQTYALNIEKAQELLIPRRAALLRIVFVELTRLLNHLMSLTTHAMDVGAITPFLFAFEEREKIFEFYERVSGARMHTNYIRPGGVAVDFPLGLLYDIVKFCRAFLSRIREIEILLSQNRIWGARLKAVGVVSASNARRWGFSGVLLRGSGVPWDLRRSTPYEIYSELKFPIAWSNAGDSYGRYLIRLEEMRISCCLIVECASSIELGPTREILRGSGLPLRRDLKISMESLIWHFRLVTRGLALGEHSVYTGTESPKGEFGVFTIYTGDTWPARCKFRSPGYFHLAGTNLLTRGALLADVVTVIGTQDIVFGEIDR